MQHTYLRYECADAFGLISASASSKVPHSNATLAFASSIRGCPVILTSAGSHCIGFHLKTTNPTIKIGHREEQNGGVGTGKALNSSQIVCLDVAHTDSDCRVATGWVDGAVRVFNLTLSELNAEGGRGLVQTLLTEDEDSDDDYISREPLVLNGHSGSPIRSISFDPKNCARLASGSSDGSVVLWDVVEECGLFRLLGHRGAITDIHFASISLSSFDSLITSSLDGLVKVWDLNAQCCVQTIASHRGKVWSSALMVDRTISATELDAEKLGERTVGNERVRLVTGDDDGLAKVWSVKPPLRHNTSTQMNGNGQTIDVVEDSGDETSSDSCVYMGSLRLPSTISSTNEHVASVRFDPSGKFVGVLHANARSVHIYAVRSPEETNRRKQRRLSRHRQKAKKIQEEGEKGSQAAKKKRGILDEDVQDMETSKSDIEREKIEAGDEFEFLGTINAAHRIRTFVFVPWKESGYILRIVCSLSSNAIEVLSLQRSKNQ